MRLLLASLLCVVFSLSVRAENWPQWRGPENNGLSGEKNIPSEWDETRNVLWKLKMPGVGSSTPAVWDKHIFLTSLEGNDQLVLLAIGSDGKERWKKVLGKGNKIARDGEGNSASSSPSTDGKHVYALVGSGDFAAFDFEGNQVWKFNVQDRYGKFEYDFGMHTTPLLHEGRLYFQIINPGGQWVVAINAANGEEVWKVQRKSDGVAECLHSYASVCLWKKDKDAYLISHGNDYAIAHDLKDGKEIWRVTGLNPKSKYNRTLRFVATPLATPDVIVVPTAKNGAVVAVKPDAKGTIDPGQTGEMWRNPTQTPDVPSPLIHDGILYLCRESGQGLQCWDARTGKEHYNKRIHVYRYRASPVYADGKVYLTARDGVISVVKAGTTFELLAQNKLPDSFTASPAISNGRIYLRGHGYLWAIGTR